MCQEVSFFLLQKLLLKVPFKFLVLHGISFLFTPFRQGISLLGGWRKEKSHGLNR